MKRKFGTLSLSIHPILHLTHSGCSINAYYMNIERVMDNEYSLTSLPLSPSLSVKPEILMLTLRKPDRELNMRMVCEATVSFKVSPPSLQVSTLLTHFLFFCYHSFPTCPSFHHPSLPSLFILLCLFIHSFSCISPTFFPRLFAISPVVSFMTRHNRELRWFLLAHVLLLIFFLALNLQSECGP